MDDHIFICHEADDAEIAGGARDALERRGYRCRLAPEDEGRNRIEAIRDSRLIVLIASAAAMDSDEIGRDLRIAADHGVAIVALRVEDAEPTGGIADALAHAHRLEALTSPLAPHFEALADLADRLLPVPGGRELTEPPRPLARRHGSRSWLPIATAGLAGLAAIALVAALV